MLLFVLAVVSAVCAVSQAGGSNLEFITLGDWGEIIFQGQTRVAAEMANWTIDHDPKFILSLGDNFYPWGLFSVNDTQLDRKWREVYHIYPELENLPWYLSIGNHDYGFDNGEEWNQIWLSDVEPLWNFPHLWYDFVARSEDGETSVHFIVVDTESMRGDVNDHELMWPWLEEVLPASTATWKIVVGHREIYSTGDKGPISSRLWNDLRPLLEQYEIDIYLCGHDHNMQHIREMNQVEGNHYVDYVVNGAGGALWYAYDEEKETILNETYNMEVPFFQMSWGFVTVNASPEAITFTYHDASGNQIYEFTRTKN